MSLNARPTLLLPIILLLAGCGSDGSAPQEQLQSITVKDANGTTTAFTALDYSGESLVRVRGYNQPGADGVVGTADDPLLNDTYASCKITTDHSSLLHDAYAEAHGSSPISIFFQAFSDCALPGIHASRISSTRYYDPGADAVWFTADDVQGLEFTLERNDTGSILTSSMPAGDMPGSSTNVNATGLEHIVYNPYAGLGSEPQTTSISYGYNASGQVSGFSKTGHQTLYDRQSDGFIKTREINPGSSSVPGTCSACILREEYEKTSSGKIRAQSYTLLDPASHDFFASIGASPTGQILLAILGIQIPTGGQLLSLDGNTYYFSNVISRYEIEKTGDRIDRIRQITGPGPDSVWYTSDDTTGSTVQFSYGIPR